MLIRSVIFGVMCVEQNNLNRIEFSCVKRYRWSAGHCFCTHV